MPGNELINNEELIAIENIFKNNNGVLFAHGFEERRNGNYEVRNLEKKAANYFGSKYCLAVSSGTAGLKIALQCANLDNNNEIITQAFNFISDGEVILDCKCKPIITNIDESLNMDVKDLEKKITEKTKAVIVCEMLGNGSDIEKISNICKKNNLLLIDDACEMIGGKYKNKYYGTFGDIGVMSLDFGKNITSGEGGLIFTDNENYYKIMKQYTDHGHILNPNYPRGADDYGKPGFNFRMTEIQGAIAMVQIDKLDKIMEMNYNRYKILDTIEDKLIKKIKIYENVKLSYDTFIIIVENFVLRKLIHNYIKKVIGTKNLPDALRWHCFYYWDHIIDKTEKNWIKKSKNLINKCIAIPILLKKNEEDYINIRNDIMKIIENYKKNEYNLDLDYLCIIPARKNSKGLVNKNGEKIYNNKSLIEIVSEKIDDSRLVDCMFFTSDSKEYIEDYKKESQIKDLTNDYVRNNKISRDISIRNEFILDVLEYCKINYKNITFKNIVLCQVTSPLFTYKDLDECIIKHKNTSKMNVISVCDAWNHSNELVTFKNNNIKFINKSDNINRQTYEKNYFINGCFYISTYKNIYENLKKNINYEPFEIENETDIFIMDKKSGIDIDDKFDSELYKNLIK